MDDIYVELESGLVFLLTPTWLKNWEEDELETFKEANDGKANKSADERIIQ